MAIVDAANAYIAAVPVTEVFADSTYQRDLDVARVKQMAAQWDPRLVDVIDVSDRGEGTHPRYAVIEGQHRWAAARLRNPSDVIVARVFTSLTVPQEAQLFHDIDTKRRKLTTWDRWKARRASGDPVVAAVEATVVRAGLVVDEQFKDGHVRCTSTLEKIANGAGGHGLLKDTLRILRNTWGDQRAAYAGALVGGMALFLHTFEAHAEFNDERLVDALIDLTPERLMYIAKARRDQRSSASLTVLVASTVLDRFNLYEGPKLARGTRLSTPKKKRAA